MNLFSIIPLVGAAVAPTISSVVDSATESLSFLDILHEAPREDETDKVQEDASTTLDRDFAELAERLRERFAQIGIDLTTPIRLKQSGRDRVVVDGDHPDRVLIESVFTNNEDLANLFRKQIRIKRLG